jgi:Protein of unknown function (DUF3754)
MDVQDTDAQERMELAARAAEEARAGTSPHAATERFIPVSPHELIERLTLPAVWPGLEPKTVRTFFKFLVHWRHLSYSERQRELLRLYAPFSPDSDTQITQTLGNAERANQQQEFIGLVRQLLARANYEEIPRDRIEEVISEQNPYGLALEVDLSDFEELHIFYRGESKTTLPPSMIERYAMRKKPVELKIYQRLFVLLKLKPLEVRVREIMLKEQVDAKRAEKIAGKLRRSLPKAITGDYIYLKLFKFIPRADLEMLLPNTRVKMRQIDKLKLGVTAGGGGAAGIATTVAKLTTVAALTNPMTVGLAMIGLGGIVFRQVSSVFATRTNYMAQLSKNLYFNNLANNHSVMAVLAERGEEEDIKEEVLLYTLLARSTMRRADLADAKLAIEHYLQSEFKVKVSFDIHDALERLLETGIVTEGVDGTFVAMQPSEGARHIDEMWDKYLDTVAARDDIALYGGGGS